MSRILVDTNVLVYVKDISSSFHKAAISLFNGKDELFTTTKNLAEYYAVVTKGEHALLNPLEALHDINEFVSICSLLYPNSSSQKICPIG
jgi:predicted nucleic acid-binding protein